MSIHRIDFLEPTNFTCNHCIGYANILCKCKRVDHDVLRFYRPWFMSEDYGKWHMICSDFQPNPLFIEPYIECHKYSNFEELFNNWKAYWYKDCYNRGVSFFVNNDFSVAYKVRTEDFIYGTMITDKGLKAMSKTYYKRSKKSLTGYKLNTVELNEPVILEGIHV